MSDREIQVENKEIIEELGVTSDDLDPTPVDAKSKNEALKVLKKTRVEESGKLIAEIQRLRGVLNISDDDASEFERQLEENGGKLKGFAMLKSEKEKLAELIERGVKCANGHIMKDNAPKGNYCDICGETLTETVKNNGCRQCDYDMCQACVDKVKGGD